MTVVAASYLLGFDNSLAEPLSQALGRTVVLQPGRTAVLSLGHTVESWGLVLEHIAELFGSVPEDIAEAFDLVPERIAEFLGSVLERIAEVLVLVTERIAEVQGLDFERIAGSLVRGLGCTAVELFVQCIEQTLELSRQVSGRTVVCWWRAIGGNLV